MEINRHIHCSGHGHYGHVPTTINNTILFCIVLSFVFVIFEASQIYPLYLSVILRY